MTATPTLTSPRQRVNCELADIDLMLPRSRGGRQRALSTIELLCQYARRSGCEHVADVALGEIIRIASEVPSIHDTGEPRQ